MTDRRTLHLSKLDEFAEWANSQGWRRGKTLGTYEALRLEHQHRRTLIYYRRDHGNRGVEAVAEHVTASGYAASDLIRRWLRERKEASR